MNTFLVIAAVLVILYLLVRAWLKKRLEKLQDVRFTDTLGGQEAPNFEVTDTEGRTHSRDSLLQGKEVLAVVLFATWCRPCEKEFPEMDAVYQKYADRMGMIAVNVDKLDDEKAVRTYAEKHHFSFPVAKGNDSLGTIQTTMYPTTLIIDRTGKIGLWRVGSIPTGAAFERIITAFMGDAYQPRQLGYYTFMAFTSRTAVPGVEFSVTSEAGTETFQTDAEGKCDVFTEKPEDLQVNVLRVPDGFVIDGTGEFRSGTGSTYISLPVKKVQ